MLYLLFNEGYSSQREDETIVRELCEEALRLAERLAAHPAGQVPETSALLAIMHFHLAPTSAERKVCERRLRWCLEETSHGR